MNCATLDDFDGRIKVAVRVRPIDTENGNVQNRQDGTSCLRIHDDLQTFSATGVGAASAMKSFALIRSLYGFYPKELYIDMVKPLVKSVVQGYNATVFAYGVTGSGKTHTMSGPNIDTAKRFPQNGIWNSDSEHGVMPRVLDDLFEMVSRIDGAAIVHISYVELYKTHSEISWQMRRRRILRRTPKDSCSLIKRCPQLCRSSFTKTT